MTSPTALVAGEGSLPLEIARRLAEKGNPPFVYALSGNNAGIGEYASGLERLERPELGKLADRLADRGSVSVILAGRVPKSLMFRPELMDDAMKSLLSALPVKDDHSLLGAIVAYFESRGIKVLPYREILPEIMAPEGHIAGRVVTQPENNDIAYGIRIASAVVPLSFGQTVVVKNGSVVAVEAMEGTDGAIERAGSISGGGVVVKMMRPDQDERYDLPTVGTGTLETMRNAGMTCLAVEAGRTVILGGELFAKCAGSWNISVTGVTWDLSS